MIGKAELSRFVIEREVRDIRKVLQAVLAAVRVELGKIDHVAVELTEVHDPVMRDAGAAVFDSLKQENVGVGAAVERIQPLAAVKRVNPAKSGEIVVAGISSQQI